MTKTEITQDILNKYKEKIEHRYNFRAAPLTLESTMNALWWAVADDYGFRLNDLGISIMADLLHMPHYPIMFENTYPTPRILIDLANKLKNPYHIESYKGPSLKVTFFGEQEAMLATLYGNLSQFLKNYV